MPSSFSTVAVASMVVLVAAACSDESAVSPVLIGEAERMVAVAPPDGWAPARTSRLTGDYFVIDVDGAEVIAAGDFRDAGSVRATTVALAWESPVLPDEAAVETACRTVAAFAERVDRSVLSTPRVPVEDCLAASVDPDLRDGFVLSFADSVETIEAGSRSFGAGILRDTVDGAVQLRVVTSLSFALPPT